MFQGMTLGEQRTLLALVAVIALGLGYKAYQDRQAISSVYIEKNKEEWSAPPQTQTLLPSAERTSPVPPPLKPTAPPAPAGKLDLNTATLAELDAMLPGIGPVKAKAILDYREKKGGFRSLEQLLDVHGIGPKTLDSIRPLATAGPRVVQRVSSD